MLLEDATGQASVDLFLRSLRFEFPVRDMVGIPGNLIGIGEPYREEKIALLLHELEHISSLTYPVGAVFTSLAIRAHDLRNSMVSQFKKVFDGLAHASPSESPNEAALELDEVLFRANDTAEFARTTNQFAELMAPLLEGLAVFAEFELQPSGGSWGWHTLLSMEYQYWLHFLLLNDREAYLASAEKGPDWVGELYDALEPQLDTARKLRRCGSSIDLMFFHQGEREPGRTAPYFYGYLFLSRLHQEWKARMPDLDVEGFFYAATVLVATVLPLTILPLFSNQDRPRPTSPLLLPRLFERMLRDALSFSASHIEQLRTSRTPLVWTSHKILMSPGWYKPDESFDDHLLAELTWTVFDIRKADKASAEIGQLIHAIESAKALVRTAERHVAVVGVDEELRALLIFDWERRHGAEIDVYGTTWFRFPSEEMYTAFLDAVGDVASPLQRVRLGAGLYRILGTRFVSARLLTYLHFWPGGVPRTGQEDAVLAADLVRVLVYTGLDPPRAFLSTDSDLGEVARRLRARDASNKLLEGFAQALAPDYADVRYALEELRAVAPADSIAGLGSKRLLQVYPRDEWPSLRSLCRAVYCRVLFPLIEESAVTSMRFDALSNEISPATRKALREWLNRGLVLARDRRCEIAPFDDAVDEVRRAALKFLGIPLIRRDGVTLNLDLAPA